MKWSPDRQAEGTTSATLRVSVAILAQGNHLARTLPSAVGGGLHRPRSARARSMPAWVPAWACPGCRGQNAGGRRSCHLCGLRPHGVAAPPRDRQQQDREPYWACSSCSCSRNFAFKDACHICGEHRAAKGASGSNGSKGAQGKQTKAGKGWGPSAAVPASLHQSPAQHRPQQQSPAQHRPQQ